MRLFRLAVILAALTVPVVGAGQPATPSGAREPVGATIIKVVPLTYARAGELAYILSLVAAPRVRVVPYYPTNSLIIAGPPAEVEQLIDIIKPSARDSSSAEVPMRLIGRTDRHAKIISDPSHPLNGAA